MKWKNLFLLITALAIVLSTPITKAFAEEDNENEEENADEIIEREDLTNAEDIPDPPRDESLIGDEEDVHEVEIQTPASVTGEKMEGSGTVVDFSTTGARAFYTIVDNEDNTFYLMIDMDKADNNVYFLSDVNQAELGSSSANQSGGNIIDNNQNNSEENEEAEQTEQAVAEATEEEDEAVSSNWGFALTVGIIGVIGAFAYHFLIKNRRKKENKTDEDDEMEEIYDDEDVIYEESDYEVDNEASNDSGESDNK